jgi:putative flavoprotein involved in K+ transport
MAPYRSHEQKGFVLQLERVADRVDVVVVGAGQAGLAMGYFLARDGRRFVIVEASDSVAAAWRARWDSLKLFTPRRYNSLPGLEFPGEPNGYPGRDEVVAYLEEYARRFDLPVVLDSPVRSVSRSEDGFVVEVSGRTIGADQVVVATGPFQVPRVPGFADRLDADVVQLHSTAYRRPEDIPAGTVVVVGGGNTGFQIAEELAASHDVHLAIGARQTPLPQRLLGRDIFWWLTRLGLLQKSVETRLGRRIRDRGPTLIGSTPRKIRAAGVTVRPRATGASGRTLTFADGTELDVDAVIWATGYRNDHSWLRVASVSDGSPIGHRRGVTDIPGLYFIGLEWQHTRGSALVGWVKDDAEFIVGRVAAYQEAERPSRSTREKELEHA